MPKTLPIVAIIGQPNAGKSTLMNKIAGKHFAITSEVAGTTRDRQYCDTSWNNATFTLVDTAGLLYDVDNELEENVRKQIEVAIEEADVLMLVVDGKEPVRGLEQKVLLKFRKLKKPILLVVNKLDSAQQSLTVTEEFRVLGVKPVFGVSSVTGRGIGDMLDYVAEQVSKLGSPNEDEPTEQSIAVSIVGKPNVGKSSIFNAIVKEERVVVSPVPGTTRTSIDTDITIDNTRFTFIDTAGLKKKEHRQAEPDVFSGFQTFKSIRRSDICFLVIDSIEEITKQDQHVAQEIFELDKGLVILANKVDLFRGDKEKLQEYIGMHFPFLWMCPVFFISAKTGEGIDDAIRALNPIFERRHKKIDDEQLKDLLKKKMKINPPKLLRDQKPPKVLGLRQTETNPPKFELLVNHPAAISQQFKKYIENSIIKDLDFYGTPITLKTLGKDKA